jgi:hypothetical protein
LKRIFVLTLAIVMILTLLGGCGSAEKTPANTDQSNSSELAEVDQKLEDLEDALSALATPGWPTGKVSDKIPEYPFGEVKNSGDFGDGEYVILISPTTKDELKEYQTQLEAAGYLITYGDRGARLGTLSLRFQFNTADTLQIIVAEAGSGAWPSLAGDLLPPDHGTLLGEVDILKIDADEKAQGHYYYAGFSLIDITEEECYAFVQKQIDNGWDGGYDMASKEMVFDGVACDLMFQFVQYYDGQGDFFCSAIFR